MRFRRGPIPQGQPHPDRPGDLDEWVRSGVPRLPYPGFPSLPPPPPPEAAELPLLIRILGTVTA